MKIRVKPLIICLVIPLAVGGLAALFTFNAMDAFSALNQPPLSPPGWLFPIVWTILYLLMGYGSYLVYQTQPDPEVKKRALMLYGVQLFLNFLWPLSFFRLGWYLPSFFLLLVLLAAAFFMTLWFSRLQKTAGILQIPYLIWLLFASYLNLGIYFLN